MEKTVRKYFLRFFSENFFDAVYLDDKFYLYVNDHGLSEVDFSGKMREVVGFQGSLDHGRTLKVSKRGSLLIINIENTGISILSVEEDRKRELQPVREMEKLGPIWIVDHIPCGVSTNQVAVLAKKGILAVFDLGLIDVGEGSLVVKTKIPFKNDRNEYCSNITCCPLSTFFAVHLKGTSRASRIVLYKMINKNLIFFNEIDLLENKITYFYSMKFYSYYRGCLVLSALSCDYPSEFFSFFIDLDKRTINEANKLRQKLQRVRYPAHLSLVDNEIIAIDNFGKLIRACYA